MYFFIYISLLLIDNPIYTKATILELIMNMAIKVAFYLCFKGFKKI